MEMINRVLRRSQVVHEEPVKPPESSFTPVAVSLDPIEQAEREHVALKVAFEAKFGTPIADMRKEHAIAKKDVELFEYVKAMRPEDWSEHLDYARSLLSKPESLSTEELASLKKTIVALEASPSAYITPEQVSALITIFMYIDPALSDYKPEPLEDAETHFRESLQQEFKSKSYELEIQQKLAQTDAQLKELEQDPAYKTETAALEEVEARLKILRAQKEEQAIIADKTQRTHATTGYQDRVKKLEEISAKTRTVTQQFKEYAAERQNAKLETDKISLRELMDLETEELKVLQVDFREALRDLETWDLNAKIARQGEEPYSSAVSLKAPAQLVRDYQLARHGMKSIGEAYWALFPSEVPDFSKLWDNMSLDTLKSLLGKARDLARDYPLECADLAANLAQTYSILTMTGNITEEARTILDRKTAENLVVDAILGQQAALYSTGDLKEISLEPLALFDFCDRAPEIAGVFMHEQMTGAKVAKNFVAWIPGGSWAPIQYAAGMLGAYKEVQVQKELSRKMSRKSELIANSILAALNGYKNGGYVGAMKEAATYAASRQMIQSAGNIFRAAVEGRAITDDLLRGWREAPVTEALKASAAWGTGLSAGLAAFGSALMATGGMVTLGAVAWPVVVTAGVGVVGRVTGNAIHEHFKSTETKLSDKQQQIARRLSSAYDKLKAERANLPALNDADFKYAAAADKPEDVIIQVADSRLQEKQAMEYNALAVQAHVAPEIIPGVLQRLTSSFPSTH